MISEIDRRINRHQRKARKIRDKLWPGCPCRVEVRDVQAGYASRDKKFVVVPLWVMDGVQKAKQPGYAVWYIAHELAHIKSPPKKVPGKQNRDIHGPHFMEALKSLCPKSYLKYEKTYKPRLSKHLKK
jgi:hypothetical protein